VTGARARLAALFSAALAGALTGCATRPPSTPFIVRSGHGPLDAGHTVPIKPARRAEIERAGREAQAARAAERQPVPAIEHLDARLRTALAALGHHESADTHIGVAVNYWRLGVYDAAFDQYSDALRLEPKNATALDGRARIWRHWGITEFALNDIHRAMFYAPERADLRNTLGTILEAAGQCQEASRAYAAALKLDPSAGWAKSNLDRLSCDRADRAGLTAPGDSRRPGS
jgi:tetratricopeptide (TPR) repeat protein